MSVVFLTTQPKIQSLFILIVLLADLRIYWLVKDCIVIEFFNTFKEQNLTTDSQPLNTFTFIQPLRNDEVYQHQKTLAIFRSIGNSQFFGC